MVLIMTLCANSFGKFSCFKYFFKAANRGDLSFSAIRQIKTKIQRNETISDVKKYLKSKECLSKVLDSVPDRYLRVKHTRPIYSFVVDNDTAIEIVKTLKSNSENNSSWLEVNAGLGIVSQHLMEHFENPLVVFDSLSCQLPKLKELIDANPGRIQLRQYNFFDLAKIVADDKIRNEGRIKMVFSDFPCRNWDEEPIAKMFGVLNWYPFIGYIVRSIIFQDPFSKLGRMEYFLLVSDELYMKISRKFNNLKISILLGYLCNVTMLGRFPRMAVLPWYKKNSEDLYLLKISPKPSIMNDHSQEQLKVLWYFIDGLYRMKTNKIIAYFENWIPDSGLLLIKEGLHPMTEIKSISPEEMIELFKIFTSHPDFDYANFIQIHESGLLVESVTGG